MKRILSILALAALFTGAASAQEIANIGNSTALVSPEVGTDGIIFRLDANYATTVGLKGNWMDPASEPLQMKKEGGIWSITIPKLEPEIYTYNFVVDGVSLNDPLNPFIQRDGSRYLNMLFVDGQRSENYNECEQRGNLTTLWYDSPSLGINRRMIVYTPYGYNSPANKRGKYPVLYLLHGGGGDEDAWSTLGRTCQILDNLIAAGKAEPMLVVMPNGNPSQYAAQTLLIPEKTIKTKYNSGFDNYTSLVSDIIPFIEKNYNVIADREHRSVAGLSMGGGQSFYVAFRNVDLFSSVGIFSSGLIGSSAIGGTPFNAEEQIPGMLSMPAAFNRFDVIYLSCGEQDGRIDGMKEFNDTLKSKGYKGVVWETFEGGHEWKVWRRSLSSYAQKIFK